MAACGKHAGLFWQRINEKKKKFIRLAKDVPKNALAYFERASMRLKQN